MSGLPLPYLLQPRGVSRLHALALGHVYIRWPDGCACVAAAASSRTRNQSTSALHRYGIYFGILGRDCAEVAADRMVSPCLTSAPTHQSMPASALGDM